MSIYTFTSLVYKQVKYFHTHRENISTAICPKFVMSDLDRSSGDSSVDSREESSEDFKLEFSEDEETLIIRMFNLVGDRWSLIAGRIPGRTAKEVEKYWTSRFSKNNQMQNPI